MNCNSIIAFVNPKSGGQKGRRVLDKLKTLLPANNVFDLSVSDPKKALETHIRKPYLRILACGGDGTAGW